MVWYLLHGTDEAVAFRTAQVRRGDLLVSISATGTLGENPWCLRAIEAERITRLLESRGDARPFTGPTVSSAGDATLPHRR